MERRKQQENGVGERERTVVFRRQPARQQDVDDKVRSGEKTLVKDGQPAFGGPTDTLPGPGNIAGFRPITIPVIAPVLRRGCVFRVNCACWSGRVEHYLVPPAAESLALSGATSRIERERPCGDTWASLSAFARIIPKRLGQVCLTL